MMKELRISQQTITFVGRVGEIADCIAQLNDPGCHLLTLTGRGGVGKTRLALEVAWNLRNSFSDGVYFIPLQALNSVDHVLSAIVTVLPMQERDVADLKQHLMDYLHDKQMLLLLDNMEHLLDFSPLLSELLLSSPQVKALVTSREPLKLREEWIRQVNGLAYPHESSSTHNTTYSAVEFFTELVNRQTTNFDLVAEYDHVVQLCRLVDGTPLALELAASWIKVIPCAAIVHEIQRDISILTSTLHNMEERHRSMRAVFDHSWGLLDDEAQNVMCRLAVFRGGFTREAAEEIAGANLPMLAALVDKSLIHMSNGSRYDLHELLRQYTEEKLIDSGDYAASTAAHARYYAGFIYQRTEALKGHDQFKALNEIKADFENVRSAWLHACDHFHQSDLMKMIEGLWILCEFRQHTQEVLALFRYAEQRYSTRQDLESLRIQGFMAARRLADKGSEEQLRWALDVARQHESTVEIAFCLLQLGRAAYLNGDVDRSDTLLKQAMLLYRDLGDRFGESWANKELMYRSSHERPWEHIRHHGFEALRLKREIGDRYGCVYPLSVAGLNAVRQGKFDEAESYWSELVTVGSEIDNLYLISYGYAHLGHKIYFYLGDFSRARDAAEKGLTLGRKIGAFDAIGFSLATLSQLASVEENYIEAKSLAEHVALEAKRGLRELELVASFALALAECGLGDYQAAKVSLLRAWTFLNGIINLVGTASALSIAAIILANEGKYSRAVGLLGLACTHPVGVWGWMEQWDLLTRLRLELEQALGTDDYLVAWQLGSQWDLARVGADIIDEFSTDPGPTAAQTNSALIDPLSNRELEVLALIGKGLTNREIAGHLYISVSTVKKHVNHIYEKLAVKNRTSAIARARELGILD